VECCQGLDAIGSEEVAKDWKGEDWGGETVWGRPPSAVHAEQRSARSRLRHRGVCHQTKAKNSLIDWVYPVLLCSKDLSPSGSYPKKQNAPDSFESRDVCRSALPQVLLNPKTNRKPQISKWPASAITSTKVTGGPSLCRDQIKFPRRFFIEECAFFCIAAAPVLVSSRNSQKNPLTCDTHATMLFACRR
jgi:hypothetical protein